MNEILKRAHTDRLQRRDEASAEVMHEQRKGVVCQHYHYVSSFIIRKVSTGHQTKNSESLWSRASNYQMAGGPERRSIHIKVGLDLG